MTHQSVTLDEIRQVTDQELIVRLQRLVHADEKLNARLLVHLGEVDARGLYRERAYSSMFCYCVEELHMSEAQAYLRIHAARLGRQFPRVVELLAQGSLHLTAIKLLAPHLTPDNHVQLLERASGKGKREIELLVAAIAPKPDVPSRLRKLPETSSAPARPGALTATLTARLSGLDAVQTPSTSTPRLEADETKRAHFALEASRPRASSRPLSPGRYKLELMAGQALHDKLQQLKDLLRHQVPDGDLAVIVERAVDVLLDQTMKQRFAHTRAPKQPRHPRQVARPRRHDSRYIPRAVVREVHRRDAGQCTFVSSEGKRCAERGFLELHHHDVPFARGGKATPENLRLVCRAHNALLAARDYGAEFMRSKQHKLFGELGPER